MTKKFSIFFIIVLRFLLIILLFSCESSLGSGDDSGDSGSNVSPQDNSGGASGDVTIRIEYTEGRVWEGTQIYCIWLESNTDDTIIPILISERLIYIKGQTGNALPYWRENKKSLMDADDIDTVTTAIPNRTADDPDNVCGVQIATPIPETASDFGRGSFSVAANVPDGLTDFTVYFEIEHSFDSNYYFSDQPSVVYSANIDLNNFPSGGVDFGFAGWCPNTTVALTDTHGNSTIFAAHELHSEEEYLSTVTPGSSDEYPATDMMMNGAKVTVVQ